MGGGRATRQLYPQLRKAWSATHAPFVGFNRAQAAVIEAAILASRLHLLPRGKVESEIAYLEIAVTKTAAAAELEAWGWLIDKIRAYYDNGKARAP